MDHEAMRQYLKELEPDASDSLGDLGCHMIENAIDALSEKFNLTEEEVEELSTKLAVGITFELEDDTEISTEDN